VERIVGFFLGSGVSGLAAARELFPKQRQTPARSQRLAVTLSATPGLYFRPGFPPVRPGAVWYSRFLNAPEYSEKLVKPTMSVKRRSRAHPGMPREWTTTPMHRLAPPKDKSYRDIVSDRSLLAST
jgi:hypothetical protein